MRIILLWSCGGGAVWHVDVIDRMFDEWQVTSDNPDRFTVTRQPRQLILYTCAVASVYLPSSVCFYWPRLVKVWSWAEYWPRNLLPGLWLPSLTVRPSVCLPSKPRISSCHYSLWGTRRKLEALWCEILILKLSCMLMFGWFYAQILHFRI